MTVRDRESKRDEREKLVQNIRWNRDRDSKSRLA